MKANIQAAACESGLKMEAYRFQGFSQPFPDHFHDYYVLGLVEKGSRRLICKGQAYELTGGDLLLLNPGDSHACTQEGEIPLDYRAINLSRETFSELTRKGPDGVPPSFPAPVLRDPEAACRLRQLHQSILDGERGFREEEQLMLLLPLLLQAEEGHDKPVLECREEVRLACEFMEEHYGQRIGLGEICRHVGLSRSTLLRAFAAVKGVTPYLYLQNIRVGQAGALLRQGVSLAETALRTGFSDQSHFTNYFSRFIGLTPGAYREIWREGDGYGAKE